MTSSVVCALLLAAPAGWSPVVPARAGDPRPIDSVPFDADEPGTYVLTGDLGPCGAAYGIRILADGVVIDLGGFALEGGLGSGPGIVAPGAAEGVVVRDGRIAGWGGDGIALGEVAGVELRMLSLHDNAGHGAHLGERARLSDCSSEFNHGGRGILTGAGATLARCTARDNEYGGLFTGAGSTLLECSAEGSFYGSGIESGPEAVLRDCRALENRAGGIRVGAGSLVSGCRASANLFFGIEAGAEAIVRSCRVRGSVDGSGIVIGRGGWAEDCEVGGNRRRGIDLAADSIARGCTVRGNGQAGLRARAGCRLLRNTCESNGGAGIELVGGGATVDGNVFASNKAKDLLAPGRGHFVVRNTLAKGRAVLGGGGFVAPFSDRDDPERGPLDNLRP